MKKLWNKWKVKWGVESDRRMIWIFIIFAITGSTTMIVRKWLFLILGIELSSPVIAFLVKWLVIFFFIYPLLLFVVGTILGERKFVTWFLNKMVSRMVSKRRTSHD